MHTDARADDALYVTNKALARLEGLVARGDVDLALATTARRAMAAWLGEADAVWQARDTVWRSIGDENVDGNDGVIAAGVHLAHAAGASLGFHETESDTGDAQDGVATPSVDAPARDTER